MRTARGGAVLETDRAIRGVRGVRGRRDNVPTPPVFRALQKIRAAVPLFETTPGLDRVLIGAIAVAPEGP
jgi:hypothetical protein